MNKNKFEEFLKFSEGETQPILIIASDNEEQEKFADFLENNSYKKSDGYKDIMENINNFKKTFYILGGDIPKEVYDIVVQFPTGLIQIIGEDMQQIVANPEYMRVSFAILTTLGNLKLCEEKAGFLIRDKVGIAYQEN